METNDNMISFYAESIEKMTGKKVVLMDAELFDETDFIEDSDFRIVRKGNCFFGEKNASDLGENNLNK